MARFHFKALDDKKNEVSGILEATDRQAALTSLSGRHELVLDVHEVQTRQGLFSRRITNEDLMVVTQQLAVMLHAGLGLRHALALVDSENPVLEDILAEVSAGISEGKPLSEMLEGHPKVFSRLYCSMVRAGETAGKLPEILSKLSEHLEHAENLRRKIQGALVYPSAVIGVSLATGAFIFTFGVQQFQEIYSGLNAELPASTQLIMVLADLMAAWWPGLLAGALMGLWLLKHLLSTGPGELLKDRLLLRMPLVAPLVRRLAIARFARTLGTLYSSGVPIVQSLELVASSTGNRVMEEVVRKAVQTVQEGEPLVAALRASQTFTRMALSMVATGEESGTLDRMLAEVADFYELQAETMLRNLVSLLEPAVIVGVGLFVAFLIMALGLPMMNLVEHLG
jgi:type IV pilus assembly protein PilC